MFLETKLQSYALVTVVCRFQIGFGQSFPAKSGWCSNISPKTQPAAHMSTEVLLSGGARMNSDESHGLKDPPYGFWINLRAEKGGSRYLAKYLVFLGGYLW